MALLDERIAFKPSEYGIFDSLSDMIRDTYWTDKELDFDRDVRDFKFKLNDHERDLIGTILKTFAQTETLVANDFWGIIGQYIPKPEFKKMASRFTENEWRHADAYQRLNDELDFTDFEAFLEDETAMARMENLMAIKLGDNGKPSIPDLALALAVFGGFTEYVNLFSQFAILLSFTQRGYFVETGNIIAWSQKDESMHAKGALATFNILMDEYPEHRTKELETKITEAAMTTWEIEKNLLDQIFADGDLENLTKQQVLNFMRFRINEALGAMKMDPIFDVDGVLLEEMDWFIAQSFGLSNGDFFHTKPVEYTDNQQGYSAKNLFS